MEAGAAMAAVVSVAACGGSENDVTVGLTRLP